LSSLEKTLTGRGATPHQEPEAREAVQREGDGQDERHRKEHRLDHVLVALEDSEGSDQAQQLEQAEEAEDFERRGVLNDLVAVDAAVILQCHGHVLHGDARDEVDSCGRLHAVGLARRVRTGHGDAMEGSMQVN
jgi:hypothetical protein